MMGPLKIFLLVLLITIASADIDPEYRRSSFQKVYPTPSQHYYNSFGGEQSYASASAAASASAYSSTGSSHARASAAASSSASSSNRNYQQQSGGHGINHQHVGSNGYNAVSGYAGGHHTGMRGLDTATSKGRNSGRILDQSLPNFHVRGSEGRGQVEGHEEASWRQQFVHYQQPSSLQTSRNSEGLTVKTTGPRVRAYQHPQSTGSSVHQQSTISTSLNNRQQFASSSSQRHVGSRYAGHFVEDQSRDTPQFWGSGRYLQQPRDLQQSRNLQQRNGLQQSRGVQQSSGPQQSWGLEKSSRTVQSIGPNNFEQLNVMKGQQKPTGSRGVLRFTGKNWQQSHEEVDDNLQITEIHSPLPSIQSHYPAPNPTSPTLRPKYSYHHRVTEQNHNGYQSSTCFYISCYSKRK